jgi:hypothetical protein
MLSTEELDGAHEVSLLNNQIGFGIGSPVKITRRGWQVR